MAAGQSGGKVRGDGVGVAPGHRGDHLGIDDQVDAGVYRLLVDVARRILNFTHQLFYVTGDVVDPLGGCAGLFRPLAQLQLARQGDLLHALADGARHADDPRPIPKIVLDHARHGGHGKGGKLNALVAGETLQGPDQGHGRDLLQVVVFDAAARVLARDHVGKVHVLRDQFIAQADIAGLAVLREHLLPFFLLHAPGCPPPRTALHLCSSIQRIFLSSMSTLTCGIIVVRTA